MANLPTRSNNPGDLKDPSTGEFRQFGDPKEGYGALLNDLQHKITTNPEWNLADFSNVYAPPTDNNDSAQYAANLANQLKVSPDTKISQLQPRIGEFADAIGVNEGFEGKNVATAAPAGATQSASPTVGGVANAVLNGYQQYLVGVLGLFGGGDFIQKVGPVAAGLGVAAITKSPAAGVAAQSITSGILGGTKTPTTQTQGTTANQMTDIISPQSQEASGKVAKVLTESLNATMTGRIALQQPDTQAGLYANSLFGIVPTPDENGNLDSSEARKKSQGLVSKINSGMGSILEAEGTSGSVKEALAEVEKLIEKHIPDTDKEIARKYARETIPIYAKENTGSRNAKELPLAVWQRMKQQEAYGKKWGILESTAKKRAAKVLSLAARNVITNNTKNKDMYESAMKMEHDLMKGWKILDRLNGKKAVTHHALMKDLSHAFGRYGALYIGDKLGGPMGAIVGDMIGRRLVGMIDKRHGKTIFETPEMHKALEIVERENPDVGLKLNEALKKHLIEDVPGEVAETGPATAPVVKGKKGMLPQLAKGGGKKIQTKQPKARSQGRLTQKRSRR